MITEWEAKYKALAADVTDEQVEAAEKMVQAAVDMGSATGQPPSVLLNMMFATIYAGRENNLDLMGLEL